MLRWKAHPVSEGVDVVPLDEAWNGQRACSNNAGTIRQRVGHCSEVQAKCPSGTVRSSPTFHYIWPGELDAVQYTRGKEEGAACAQV
jgi:hypothetical protein